MRAIGLLLGTLLLLVGCAHTSQFPKNLNEWQDEKRVRLPASGRILFEQNLSRAGSRVGCGRAAREVNVELKRSGTQIPMRSQCDRGGKRLILTSTRYLSPDYYGVKLRKHRGEWFEGRPRLLVEYLNPEFESGDDMKPAGAVALEDAAELSGSVNYSAGDRTDWIAVKGNGELSVIQIEGDPKEFSVALYEGEAGQPAFVGPLKVGKKNTLRLGQNSLIKVQGLRSEAGGEYQMLRSSSSATRRVSVPVIDSYALSGEETLVLFEPLPGLAPGQEISVIGAKSDGKKYRVGTCYVASVEETQATCKLFQAAPKGALWAQLAVKG